ncbi:MAG: hypothetical protein BWY82_02297 [Verrucomicrobia bacterium ADurb.Bin474]|nr:MAG: hypothetical protein BWY82_02297 [Verrucomicrobia bacterium ADurb.Bin474]
MDADKRRLLKQVQSLRDHHDQLLVPFIPVDDQIKNPVQRRQPAGRVFLDAHADNLNSIMGWMRTGECLPRSTLGRKTNRLLSGLVTFKEPMQLTHTRRMTHLAKRLCLDLANALTGDVKLTPHFFQRPAVTVG